MTNIISEKLIQLENVFSNPCNHEWKDQIQVPKNIQPTKNAQTTRSTFQLKYDVIEKYSLVETVVKISNLSLTN